MGAGVCGGKRMAGGDWRDGHGGVLDVGSIGVGSFSNGRHGVMGGRWDVLLLHDGGERLVVVLWSGLV